MLLLVARWTGVKYTHQCGGVACNQEGLRGFALPFSCGDLYHPFVKWAYQLYDGVPSATLDPALYRELVQWLRKLEVADGNYQLGEVDFSDRRGYIQEAWIPLRGVHIPDARKPGAWLGPFDAVLVWENSD